MWLNPFFFFNHLLLDLFLDLQPKDCSSFISYKKCECIKVYSHEKYHSVKTLIARKVMQVDEMIMEEEEEENINKNPQTARVSRHSDLGQEPVSRQGNT